MLFKKRIERAFSWMKGNKKTDEQLEEELYLEKGDMTSITIAGLLTILIPSLIALAVIAGIALLIFL